jgi:hypothetical protein
VNTIIATLLALHLLAPLTAFAEQSKDLTSYSLKHWGFVLGMALLGGFVSWWGKVRRGELRATSMSSLIGELCTSAFAGLLAFFICEWANFPQMLTAAMTGICGHMGTRAVTMFEEWGAKRFGAELPPKLPE